MSYFPILKAKQGELRALQEWDDARRPTVHPIVEVTPWERFDEARGVERYNSDTPEISGAVKRLSQAWDGKSAAMYVDAAYAEPDLAEDEESWRDVEPVLLRVLRELQHNGTRAAPVLRASVAPAYAQSIGNMLKGDQSASALIRITAEDLDDTVIPLRTLVNRTVDATGLPPERVSLLLDFGPVSDEGAMALAARLARFVLPQLAEDNWASLSLSSGAFPVNLSDVQAFEIAKLPRWDFRLWESLRSFELPGGRLLDYSDYAVTHPALPVGAPFAAPPQLRYTQNSEWLVMKGKRQERRGHAQFYDICAAVLKQLGPQGALADQSWGDQYIHGAARMAVGPDSLPHFGTGNASTWRAVATSHHLAHTADQLAAEGAA